MASYFETYHYGHIHKNYVLPKSHVLFSYLKPYIKIVRTPWACRMTTLRLNDPGTGNLFLSHFHDFFGNVHFPLDILQAEDRIEVLTHLI